ncbi:hypothetical protein P3T37_007011 [Kitasatospora sp. MAA4]|uniref:hypothetical protein n=1 Tax=Kitasatospora sp. MAA4 TaxID=3035093 RepID=UPI0024762CC6|nr:hypothetical protein [Kitasatospora sp. MAA4]MDH6137578.1 hypothetical protein [Kitasatospora sp. MAA4]
MTALAPFPSLTRHRPPVRLRSRLAGVFRRLALSPLDSPVLHALHGPLADRSPVTARRASGVRATWRTVTGPDGRPRLEASWAPDH